MVQCLNWNPTLKVGMYDLRRANDSFYFAAVGAGEKVLERTGFALPLQYARSRLEKHLKITDHGLRIAENHYNQSGVGDQLIDFGNGFAAAFEECGSLDRLFERSLSPKELADAVRLSHRSQGLRAICAWVDRGLIPSPIGTCQWLRLLWSGFLARLIAHEFSRYGPAPQAACDGLFRAPDRPSVWLHSRKPSLWRPPGRSPPVRVLQTFLVLAVT
jgi:hypothetical protein